MPFKKMAQTPKGSDKVRQLSSDATVQHREEEFESRIWSSSSLWINTYTRFKVCDLAKIERH